MRRIISVLLGGADKLGGRGAAVSTVGCVCKHWDTSLETNQEISGQMRKKHTVGTGTADAEAWR